MIQDRKWAIFLLLLLLIVAELGAIIGGIIQGSMFSGMMALLRAICLIFVTLLIMSDWFSEE